MTTARRRVVRSADGERRTGRATLAVEEPLEVRVDGEVLAVTMRTPGADFDLALGLAITDGGVDPAEVHSMRYCGEGAGEVVRSSAAADLTGPFTGGFNVVDVATRSAAGAPVRRHRHQVMSSACGICGADTVADLRRRAGSVAADGSRIADADVVAVPPTVRAAQTTFDATGGTHAAALLDPSGSLLVVREDVGRHNAVDKVIGWAATAGRLPLAGHVLFTSGRIAFEIVAKAALAGIPIVIAVSAPTSLAVDLAEEVGMTLVGFVRGEELTVYCHAERVVAVRD